MAENLATVRALVFDVGGTVFDWRGTIRREVEALAAERGTRCDGSAFALAWRQGMFALLGEMNAGRGPKVNADVLHRRALDEILPDFPQLELTPEARDELNDVWHRLDVYPDFPPALDELRARFTVVVLTILSWSIVVDSSRRGGLSWDGILSCEFLAHYKPHPEAYRTAVSLLRLRPEEAMMVAAHPGDLDAAAAVGYRTAFVARAEPDGQVTTDSEDDPSSARFDVSVDTFEELVAAIT